MRKRIIIGTVVTAATALLFQSCLKESTCTYNVFEDEELYMKIYVDGMEKTSSDTAENQIYVGFRYFVDTSRTDTLKFYYDTHYMFEDESAIVISVVKFADFAEVFDFGNGLLNYAKFDSLRYEGVYEYVARTEHAPEHGVDIWYRVGDSLEYKVDQNDIDPGDFGFSASNFLRHSDVDCYGRNFKWFSYEGNLDCRLIEKEGNDTVYLTDGEFRAILTQYHY